MHGQLIKHRRDNGQDNNFSLPVLNLSYIRTSQTLTMLGSEGNQGGSAVLLILVPCFSGYHSLRSGE